MEIQQLKKGHSGISESSKQMSGTVLAVGSPAAWPSQPHHDFMGHPDPTAPEEGTSQASPQTTEERQGSCSEKTEGHLTMTTWLQLVFCTETGLENKLEMLLTLCLIDE